jgi:hypothetical protein
VRALSLSLSRDLFLGGSSSFPIGLLHAPLPARAPVSFRGFVFIIYFVVLSIICHLLSFVWGLGVGVSGFDFWVQGLGCRVWGAFSG